MTTAAHSDGRDSSIATRRGEAAGGTVMGRKYEIKVNSEGQLILCEHGLVTRIGTEDVNEWVNQNLGLLDEVRSIMRDLTA